MTISVYAKHMQEQSENVEELNEMLHSGDEVKASKAVEALSKLKGRSATVSLSKYLLTAPAGLLATRAAIALENRKHQSCLPIIYEVYQTRPDLVEDVVPILSALEDPDGIGLIVGDLDQLLAGEARLSTLSYLIKCADPEAVVEIALLKLVSGTIQGADDDLKWAVDQLCSEADDALLEGIKETAAALGPHASEIVAPYMPEESELEREAPNIARAFVKELERQELIELVPDSLDALVETLTSTILDARSPKGLIRDVERILMDSTSIEEVYADREDLKRAFARITSQ